MKADERQRLLAWRRTIGPEQKDSLHEGCRRQVEIWLLQRRQQQPELGDANHPVAVYMPVSGEPDLRPLYDKWHQAGLQLALPAVVKKNSSLQFLAWLPGAALTRDLCGIAIPAMARPVTPALILAPCVGYTVTGYRLGYGGGYYDRTLAVFKEVQTAGIAFKDSTGIWTPEAHDQPLQAIITEMGSVNF